MIQTASLQRQRSKQGGPGTGAEVSKNKNNSFKTTPDGLQEGAGGQCSTVLCGACTVAPGLGTSTTAVSH